jgi:hypothetical protein
MHGVRARRLRRFFKRTQLAFYRFHCVLPVMQRQLSFEDAAVSCTGAWWQVVLRVGLKQQRASNVLVGRKIFV